MRFIVGIWQNTSSDILYTFPFTFLIMALYTMATDLNTKETIWVSTNVVKGRPQLNSHRSESYAKAGIDGFPAWELAGLHTDYQARG